MQGPPTNATLDRWRRMERNENAFFSLWCNVDDSPQALILWNRKFPTDPIFNHATRTRCRKEESEDLVKNVRSRFKAQGVKPCFYVSPLTEPVGFAEVLLSLGYRFYDSMSMMEFKGPVGDVGERVVVERVEVSSCDIWSRIYNEAFGIPTAWRREVKRCCSIIATQQEVTLFLAYYRSEAAGGLALYSEDGVGGIYCVGTLPKLQRQGIGYALLQTAAAESKEIGNEILCLQTLGQDQLEAFYSRNRFVKAFTRSIYISR